MRDPEECGRIFPRAKMRVESGLLRLTEARAGGYNSSALMVSPNPEPGEPRFKTADIISYPLSILLPCGVFPGRISSAQFRWKIFVVLPRAGLEDR